MADGQTHRRIGVVAGATAAALRAAQLDSPCVALEAIAGGFGGALGATVPDVLEPATSPRHRNLWHSIVAGTTLAGAALQSWEVKCRSNCTHWEQAALTHAVGCAQRVEAENKALFWRLAAAFLVGFAVGFTSHLLLDGQTPDGIPLLVK